MSIAGPEVEVEALRRQAERCLNRGDFVTAEQCCRRIIAVTPEHADAHLLCGIAVAAQQRLREAIALLQRAAALDPRSAESQAQLARCLSMAGRIAEALAAADRALSLMPEDALTFDTLGVVYSRANAHAQACAVFQHAIARAPRVASYHFNLASSLKFLGDFDAAEHAYEACLRADPHFWKAHSGLAQLRKQTPDSNHIARLQGQLPVAAGKLPAQVHLHQALAKEYEDLGDEAAAFGHLSAAKTAKRGGYRYSFADDATIFETLQHLFPNPPAQTTPGCDSREPIFVIGMPRSGTTLVERILSSHPDVHSAGELQNFGRIVKQASGTASREMLDVATLERALHADARVLGERYLASTRPSTGQTPRFVDKMPLNFFYAGFIARALPNARMVCLRRHPLDTCLSNFRQLFSLDNAYYHYADDLLDCGRYYILFDRLMQHWQRVLPGRVLEVRYEGLIEAQKAETRRLLAFCDLDWNDVCLQFERNTAPVATASAVQVRAPIYRSSMQRWKRYEAELAPLRALLETSGIATN